MKAAPGQAEEPVVPTTRPRGGEGAPPPTAGGRSERVVSGLLLAGLLTAVGLMVAGVVLAATGTAGPIPRESFLGGLFRALVSHEPWGFFILGLLVLLAVPVVWVAATLVFFARQRAWWFSAAALVVLAIIASSVFLGLRG